MENVKNMKYEKAERFSDKKFKRLVGIPRELFEIFVEVLKIALELKHKRGGKKPKLSIEDILLMTLTYYRDYPTFFSLGFQYGIDEANAYRWVKWVEEIIFQNIRKEERIEEDKLIDISVLGISNNKLYLVDVTECQVERPKNKEIQKEYYSGKKKKHTIKIQIILDEKTKKIISVAFDKGSTHDYNLFKQSTSEIEKETTFVADSGYQGLSNIFTNSTTPKKKSKNHPLSEEDKDSNYLISIVRIPIEHINCQLKVFRILAERYRSRRNSFFRRAVLLCEFYNLCLNY